MDLFSTLASMASAVEVLKTAFAARDQARADAALSDMSGLLADAQTARLDLLAQLGQCRAQCLQLQLENHQAHAAAQQRQRYALLEIRPGAYVYALEPLHGQPAPAHYVCQVCFDAGKQSVLQRSLDGRLLRCLVDTGHDITLVAFRRDGQGR